MPAPVAAGELLDLILKSNLLDPEQALPYIKRAQDPRNANLSARTLAEEMVASGLLTPFHARLLMLGKWKGFFIAKYKVLEQLGAGNTSNIFLCVHKTMQSTVAVKILAKATAKNADSLKRFNREARAAAGLDHPNIVRAYDIGEDKELHFLVMDYVDGTNLEKIVAAKGPLEINRACHYIRMAAQGLQYAHQNGMVHRDIKPANLILSRDGVVKILDMGVARLLNTEEENLTQGLILGSVDFVPPEQAEDSHNVDFRSDIYGLGATFYYLLTGKSPIEGTGLAQKLVFLHARSPKPIVEHRPDVPSGVVDVVKKMMAKQPAERYQSASEVVEALAWWTRLPVLPPPEDEMPKRSLATVSSTSTKSRMEMVLPPLPEPSPMESPPVGRKTDKRSKLSTAEIRLEVIKSRLAMSDETEELPAREEPQKMVVKTSPLPGTTAPPIMPAPTLPTPMVSAASQPATVSAPPKQINWTMIVALALASVFGAAVSALVMWKLGR